MPSLHNVLIGVVTSKLSNIKWPISPTVKTVAAGYALNIHSEDETEVNGERDVEGWFYRDLSPLLLLMVNGVHSPPGKRDLPHRCFDIKATPQDLRFQTMWWS